MTKVDFLVFEVTDAPSKIGAWSAVLECRAPWNKDPLCIFLVCVAMSNLNFILFQCYISSVQMMQH